MRAPDWLADTCLGLAASDKIKVYMHRLLSLTCTATAPTTPVRQAERQRTSVASG